MCTHGPVIVQCTDSLVHTDLPAVPLARWSMEISVTPVLKNLNLVLGVMLFNASNARKLYVIGTADIVAGVY